MRKHLFLPVIVALFSLPCQAGDIYKWYNDGRIIYGEYPPAGVEAEKLSRSSAVRLNSQQHSAQQLLKLSDQAEEKKARSEKIVADANAYKQQRSENCDIARRNLAMFQAGGRHRFKLPDGSVKYLDEAETQSRIEEANGQIRDFCD